MRGRGKDNKIPSKNQTNKRLSTRERARHAWDEVSLSFSSRTVAHHYIRGAERRLDGHYLDQGY